MNYELFLIQWISIMCMFKTYVFSINTGENSFLNNYYSKMLYSAAVIQMVDYYSQILNSHKVLKHLFNSNTLSKCMIISNTIIQKEVRIWPRKDKNIIIRC